MAYAWAWNKNDELWHGVYESWEEAVAEATMSLGVDEVFYVGKCEMFPLAESIDPDNILEYLDSQYGDESGCDYYIYDGVEEEHKNWLEEKISEVIQEFHKRAGISPPWFKVVTKERVG